MFKGEATQTEIEYHFEYKKVWPRQQTAGMNKLVNVLVITDHRFTTVYPFQIQSNRTIPNKIKQMPRRQFHQHICQGRQLW